MIDLKQNHAFNVKDDLKRVFFLFEETPIEIKFIKEYKGMNFAGIKVDIGIKGSKSHLPLFIARILQKDGYIEFIKDPFATLAELHAKQWEQERALYIHDLPESFYIRLIHKLKELRESVSNNPTIYLLQEQQRFESAFQRLLNDRENRILRNLTSSFIPGTDKNLTISEVILIEYLVNILKTWEDQFLTEKKEKSSE